MRKRLGKIPQLPLRFRIVFLGEEANVVTQFEQALEQFPRFIRSPHQVETIRQPE